MLSSSIHSIQWLFFSEIKPEIMSPVLSHFTDKIDFKLNLSIKKMFEHGLSQALFNENDKR